MSRCRGTRPSGATSVRVAAPAGVAGGPPRTLSLTGRAPMEKEGENARRSPLHVSGRSAFDGHSAGAVLNEGLLGGPVAAGHLVEREGRRWRKVAVGVE